MRGASRFSMPMPDVPLVCSTLELHRLDPDAPRTLVLRAALRVRRQHAEVREAHPVLRAHEHHRRRHTGEREPLDVPIAIDAGERATLRSFVADRSRDDVAEAACTLIRYGFGVWLARDDDEVVTTNVPNEIAAAFADHRVRRVADGGPEPSNDDVGRREPERVRERLEVVEVQITDRERIALRNTLRDLLLDRMPTRQSARRVAITFTLDEPQQRRHSRAQLPRIERLREVIVRAGGKPFDLALDLRLRGEHEHRNARRERIALHVTADFESRHPWHAVIEDDEVRLAFADRRERSEPIFGQADLVSRRTEEVTKHEPHVLVVVGEQQVTHYRTAA